MTTPEPLHDKLLPTETATEVPLAELLRRVPLDLRHSFPDGPPELHGSRMIPVGRLCHRAADALEAHPSTSPCSLDLREALADLVRECHEQGRQFRQGVEDALDHAERALSASPAPVGSLEEVRERLYDIIRPYAYLRPSSSADAERQASQAVADVLHFLSAIGAIAPKEGEFCGVKIKHDPRMWSGLGVFRNSGGEAVAAFAHSAPDDTITMRREDVAWLHFVASNHVTDQAKQKALQILTTALEEKT